MHSVTAHFETPSSSRPHSLTKHEVGMGLHSVSVVLLQAVLTPAVHVAPAAQAVHGAIPEAENDVPAAHATWHTVSVVLVQAVFTPAPPHVESAAHASHGALPVAEKVEPITQATWHIVSVVVVQAVLTP